MLRVLSLRCCERKTVDSPQRLVCRDSRKSPKWNKVRPTQGTDGLRPARRWRARAPRPYTIANTCSCTSGHTATIHITHNTSNTRYRDHSAMCCVAQRRASPIMAYRVSERGVRHDAARPAQYAVPDARGYVACVQCTPTYRQGVHPSCARHARHATGTVACSICAGLKARDATEPSRDALPCPQPRRHQCLSRRHQHPSMCRPCPGRRRRRAHRHLVSPPGW